MRYKLETTLAADVVAFLEKAGWEVFEEVSVGGADPVDIVATKFHPSNDGRKMVWAVECKLVLSWHLLTQARACVPYANYVSVAVPRGKGRSHWEDNQTILDVLQFLRIGRIIAHDGYSNETAFVRQEGAGAPFNTDANVAYFLDALRPEHKTHARAGGNRGGHFTPFKEMAAAVATYVQQNAGAPLKTICELEAVKKYYPKPAQAKRNIREHLVNKVIKHCELKAENGKLYVYPYHPALTTEPRI